MKLLSKKQLAMLGAEANSAFAFVAIEDQEVIANEIAEERGKDDPFACRALVKKTAIFNAWRKREIRKALAFKYRCPPDSFSMLEQDDFNDVIEHFRLLAGNAEGALHARFKSGGNDCRQILANIEKSCKERELLYPNYPEAICLRQYRCKLSAASLQQLRRILYTVRSRRQKTTDAKFEKGKRYSHSRKHLN